MKKASTYKGKRGTKWDHESPLKGKKAPKGEGLLLKTGKKSNGHGKKVRLKSTDGIPENGKWGLPEEERLEHEEAGRKMVEDLLNGNNNGGDFWTVRSQYDKEKLFSDPLLMLQAAGEYFNWNKKNPWVKYEWKDHKLRAVPLARPLTMEGLTSYMNCSVGYFRMFKTSIKKDDPQRESYLTVIEVIEQSIRRQKFEGAAIGAFNANLISYDLGIRKDVPNGGAMGGGLNVIVEKPEYESLLEETKAMLEALDDIEGNEGVKQLT